MDRLEGHEMKKVQVRKLSGAALDWAVAIAEKLEPVAHEGEALVRCREETAGVVITSYEEFSPRQNWAHAGPIIDREDILLNKTSNGRHSAQLFGKIGNPCMGDTKLVAAMRAFVGAYLGDEVLVPKVLMEKK
ncbi:DUF2591 domain-containing protein [Oxalobacter sp. OttesenSCG-928-P03]|nr:DUF2591 domain-containing protein [Oxalobacter sp. OttesenSCG-928-P03]